MDANRRRSLQTRPASLRLQKEGRKRTGSCSRAAADIFLLLKDWESREKQAQLTQRCTTEGETALRRLSRQHEQTALALPELRDVERHSGRRDGTGSTIPLKSKYETATLNVQFSSGGEMVLRPYNATGLLYCSVSACLGLEGISSWWPDGEGGCKQCPSVNASPAVGAIPCPAIGPTPRSKSPCHALFLLSTGL